LIAAYCYVWNSIWLKNMKHAEVHKSTVKLPKKTSAKASDKDNPAWTEEMLGEPVLKRGRRPQEAPTKVLTSIRLDADVMAFFKSQGDGYQSRINETLRKEVDRKLTDRAATVKRKCVAA
jgi:uncharacterized protein (DUF4415 family)